MKLALKLPLAFGLALARSASSAALVTSSFGGCSTLSAFSPETGATCGFFSETCDAESSVRSASRISVFSRLLRVRMTPTASIICMSARSRFARETRRSSASTISTSSRTIESSPLTLRARSGSSQRSGADAVISSAASRSASDFSFDPGWFSAQVTLLLTFVAMYTALGPHLTAFGLTASQTMILRLVALPGMFAALLVGPLSHRLPLAAIARAGMTVGVAGLLVEALLSSTLIGTAAGSVVFVAGISLAVSSMISLFGEAAPTHRAGGMALNGFVLFLGASIGALTSALGLSFPVLLTLLAGLLVMAALCLTRYARVAQNA